MRKPGKLVIVSGCILLAGAAWTLLPGSSGPSSAGHSLHDWINIYRGPEGQMRATTVEQEGAKPNAEQVRATAAIRSMGATALPCLLKWLQYKRPAWQEKLSLLPVDRFPITRSLTYQFSWEHEIDLHQSGLLGLAILGEEAKSCAPQLMELAKDSDTSRAYRALFALSRLGKEGLTRLAQMADDPASGNQLLAIKALASVKYLGVDASAVLPVLAQLAQNPDRKISEQAVYSLCNLGIQPETTFAALTNALSRKELRIYTIHQMRYFGDAEVLRPLVPVLKDCLADPDVATRMKAAELITEISPEVALQWPDARIRWAALRHLRRTGTALPEDQILPYVRACVQDPDPNVRQAAENALALLARTEKISAK